MQRRGESGQPVKGRRTTRPKASKAPTANLFTEHSPGQLKRVVLERDEALEQLAATAEILSVISNSPADTQPVFDAIVRSGLKLFPHALISVALRDGDMIKVAAIAEPDPDRVEAWRRTFPNRVTREYMHATAILDRKIVDIADVREAPLELTTGAQNFLTSGYRAITIMPMMCGSEAIGALSVVRLAPGPLSDKQLAVLRTFAAQAVIAIENTRILSELRESLQQQTATADVLKVISSSPGELEPVFQAMLENATRICEAKFGSLYLRDANAFRAVATHNAPRAYVEARKRDPVRPPPDSALGQVANTREVAQIVDITTVKSYTEGDPYLVSAVKLGGYRTIVAVPMLKDNELIGAITICRQEVQPFTDKQIELVSNFAAQAVIAIENTRLLKDLRQRTDDLTEALEQQTATSEVLKVISSSPGELVPVFTAMLANAVQICEATFGMLFRCEDGVVRADAMQGVPPAFAEFWQRGPQRPGRRTALGRTIETKQTVHIVDVTKEPAYVEGESVFVAAVKLGGFRTILNVPMLKDNEVIGTLAIYRQEVSPFSDKQIELVQNFAAQAVIAIENTRLLNELRKSLQQQTATAEVLKVISSSPGELEPVFKSMLDNAVRICGAKFGNLWLREGDAFRIGATHGAPAAYVDYLRREKVFRPTPKLGLGRLASTKEAFQVEDLAAVPSHGDKMREATIKLAGARTLVVVPMLKDDEVIGAVAIYRQEVRPFAHKQIELLKNFAAQAVIAIENTRLLSELRNLYSNRPPPPTCLRSSAVRRASLIPFFRPCWRTPRVFARLSSAFYGFARKADSVLLRYTTRRLHLPRSGGVIRLSTPPWEAAFASLPILSGLPRLPTCRQYSPTSSATHLSSPASNSVAIEPCLTCRCSRKMN